MAQSPEYPSLRWMPPKSWTNASRRFPADIKWIVIHTTEGSEGATSAEDGAAYDQRRTDGTSAHFYVDSNSVVQCVRTEDIAHTARATGNRHGIHIEVCGRAGQSAAQWNDAASRATIEQLAELCKMLRRKYPVPLVNLTPAQVADFKIGFCEHKDISLAFGQSTHTDPGPNFPWQRLFALIEEEDAPMSEEVQEDVKQGVAELLVDMVENRATNQRGRQAAQRLEKIVVHPIVEHITKALASFDAVDEVALANALAPALADAVIQRLPSGSDPVTKEELVEALAETFRSAFGPSEEPPADV
ncbi:MAG TPA: peptidoglycan recognition family protein [Candidatus Eisenbacteria bacterium]|nr:peptidoglycan recognition family protein [Candidatus Eisenbacteria bacterium]